MLVDSDQLRDALVQASRSVAHGMLRHRDEAQVLEDLDPSLVTLQPQALGAARRSMVLARRTEPDIALTYALSAIPRTVQSFRQQAPREFEELRTQASTTSLDRVAGGLADFVVATTFVQLEPVFEQTATEDPRPENDYADVLTAMHTYIETVDETIREVGPRVDEVQRAMQRVGLVDWGLSRENMLTRGAFRTPQQLAFAGQFPFTFIDARVMPGGDVAARESFRANRASGVLRLFDGGFLAWMDGAPEGHATLEGATAAAGLHILSTRR